MNERLREKLENFHGNLFEIENETLDEDFFNELSKRSYLFLIVRLKIFQILSKTYTI